MCTGPDGATTPCSVAHSAGRLGLASRASSGSPGKHRLRPRPARSGSRRDHNCMARRSTGPSRSATTPRLVIRVHAAAAAASESAAAPGPPRNTARLAGRPKRGLRFVWNQFQYSEALVRSSQSSSGLAGGASDGYGLGRGAAGPDRRCTTSAAGALPESSFRTDPSIYPVMLRHRHRYGTE